MNTVQRFEDKFIPEPNSGCFLWLGSFDNSGYGRFFFNGRNWKANRVAWLLAHDEDPGELFVLHRCDNRLCVNPNHLFLGTNQDNMIDMVRKGRHHLAKLDPGKVREIRRRHQAGVSYRDLGRIYRLDRDSVRRAVRGKAWAYVD